MKRLVIGLDETLTDDKSGYAGQPPQPAGERALRAYKAAGFEIVIMTAPRGQASSPA